MSASAAASRGDMARLLGRVAAFDPGLTAEVAGAFEGLRREVALLRIRCRAGEAYALRLEHELAAGHAGCVMPNTWRDDEPAGQENDR